METAIRYMDVISGLFFVASLFCLRITVLNMIEGDSDAFSIMRNIKKQLAFPERQWLYLRAMATTRRIWAKKKAQIGAGELTQDITLYNLAQEVRKYRGGDPVDYDALVLVIRAIAWGKWTMGTASGAFVFKVVGLVLHLWPR